MNTVNQVGRRRCLQLVGGLSLTALPLCVGGCTPAVDGRIAQAQAAVLRDDLPAEILSLADGYATFEEGKSLTLVGRIFSSLGSPFDPDAASFNLIELPKPGHDHENPGDCPFCKRDMENAASAIVQIVDTNGEIMKPSAEKLLGLSKNQDVVVEGEASKVGEFLIVNARSLHILSDVDATELAKRIHEKAG